MLPGHWPEAHVTRIGSQMHNVLMRAWADLKELPFRFLVNFVAASILTPRFLRTAIWLVVGIKTRTDNLYPNIYVRTNQLSVGRGTAINAGCHFENRGATISIGKGCGFGPGVALLADTHDIGPSSRRAGARQAAPVVVEDGCWLGGRSVVLPGVTIAKGCIIAAGAVVSTSTRPNGVYAGSPARRIRDLPED